MNKLLLTTAFLALLSACRKSEPPPLQLAPYAQWEGTAVYSRNGVQYDAKAHLALQALAADTGRYTVRVGRWVGGDPTHAVTEELVFGNLQTAAQPYSLADGDHQDSIAAGQPYVRYVSADYDMVFPYQLLKDEPRLFTITAFDSTAGELQGIFTASFAAQGAGNTDTIRFTQGQVRVKLQR